jgi:hypothetical protein
VLPCQPRRLKLPAAGFVRPAPLLGCSEKSPRQGARAGLHQIDHRANLKVIGADGALIERLAQARTGAAAPRWLPLPSISPIYAPQLLSPRALL